MNVVIADALAIAMFANIYFYDVMLQTKRLNVIDALTY
jgi:hypothetical protein